MVIIKIEKTNTEIIERPEKKKIRRYFDEKSQKWYFSVVDVIGILTESTDARNYWKVLKNRLNKRQSELVTRCNQLKMKAKDGKYYLTDTADSETMIHIIESVPRASVEAFKVLIREIEENVLAHHGSPNQIELSQNVMLGEDSLAPKVHQEPESEAELFVDAYETGTAIFIEAMVAGVEPDDLHISIESKKISIVGKRVRTKNNSDEESVGGYLCEELFWTTFSRVINLPTPIETDRVKTVEQNGFLTIELSKRI